MGSPMTTSPAVAGSESLIKSPPGEVNVTTVIHAVHVYS